MTYITAKRMKSEAYEDEALVLSKMSDDGDLIEVVLAYDPIDLHIKYEFDEIAQLPIITYKGSVDDYPWVLLNPEDWPRKLAREDEESNDFPFTFPNTKLYGFMQNFARTGPMRCLLWGTPEGDDEFNIAWAMSWLKDKGWEYDFFETDSRGNVTKRAARTLNPGEIHSWNTYYKYGSPAMRGAGGLEQYYRLVEAAYRISRLLFPNNETDWEPSEKVLPPDWMKPF